MTSHKPTSLRNYQSIHETCLGHLRDRGVIGLDTLVFDAGDQIIELDGEISCKGGIVVRVSKDLKVLDDSSNPLVQTVLYSYNASVGGHGSFLRWDNAHRHPGHADAHHRHAFDWRTGTEEPGSPVWVGQEGWETLTAFLEAVERWYWVHREELPEPDGFPALRVHGSRR